MTESNGVVDNIECSSAHIVTRGAMDALFELFIDCGDQGIVNGLYSSLALMLSCRDKVWIPDTMCFVEYPNRSRSSRGRLVVDWENMESRASTKGCTSVQLPQEGCSSS